MYYVYVYLDPRKPGDYNYGKYHFDYEPFYVGYGKNKRCFDHINECKWELNKIINPHKTYRIMNILSLDLYPIILKLFENITFNEANNFEAYIIKLIGRDDVKLGPLTNLTDGGRGRLNYTVTVKTRKRLSETCRGKLNGMYNKKHNIETKKLISIRNTGKIRTSEFKKNMSNLFTGKGNPFYNKHHTEETKEILRKKCVKYGINNGASKKYKFISPSGIEYVVVGGFDIFCKNNKLSRSLCYRNINNGKINTNITNSSTNEIKNSQGWTVYHIKDDEHGE